MLLALLLLPATPMYAVAIDSQHAFIVTNTKDHGAGSLRQALENAPDGATITFDIPTSDPGYHAGTWIISLTSGQLAVDKDITISGPGTDRLVLTRAQNAPAFDIFPAHPIHALTIEGLTVSDEFAPSPFALLTAATTAAVLLSLGLFWRDLQRSKEKRFRFGLLWDGHRHPICARCNESLQVLNDFSFQCRACRVELAAREDTGMTISPREALARIQLKEYW
jgi:hypothetical protein